MPPACTPEKHNGNYYCKTDEDYQHPNAEYATPPRAVSNITEGEEKHINWLSTKLPCLTNIFKLHKQIGEGTFSAVFLASLLNDPEQTKQFAVKHLIPTTHPTRIQDELRCLKLIGGQDNVVGIDLCLRDKENIVFIMPYFEHKPFIKYVHSMNVEETALYIKNLLIALKRVHSFGIIHRDVKPNNFLYNRETKKFLLVDFGLAQSCSVFSKPPDMEPINTNRKRKRELVKTDDICEIPTKRLALELKNVNTFRSNAKESPITTGTLEKTDFLNTFASKENHFGSTVVKNIFKKSPIKSPTKPLVSKEVVLLKSPYKFTGLDLPPNHPNLSKKMPGQRRLFDDDSDTRITPLHSSALSTVSTKSRDPINYIAPSVSTKKVPLGLQRKTKQQNTHVCKCFNKPSVCKVCLLRKPQDAPRAGTPGFRPPEVLLKYNKQTTAVDIWAVGIILLCILSDTYPFFRAPDDTTALAEMISLFGDEEMKKLGKILGCHLMCSVKKPPLDLHKVCSKLRARKAESKGNSQKRCKKCEQLLHNCLCCGTPMMDTDDMFPSSAYDLLNRLLDINPHTRITAEEALKHPFLNEF